MSARSPQGASVYRVVQSGREVQVPLDSPGVPGFHGRRRARFRNTLQPHSLQRIRMLVGRVRTLTGSVTTRALIESVGAEADLKGATGALAMLGVYGVVHAVAGRGRQLFWHPGPRPAELGPPRGLRRERYQRLSDLLQQGSGRSHSTDFLVVRAGFDPDLDLGEEALHERAIRERDLPINTFLDHGKSGRKFVLGALKALYWLELVAWRNYSGQAIEWWWVGPPAREGATLPRLQEKRVPPKEDPYLTDEPPKSRYERLRERAIDLEQRYENDRQHWIEMHHPEAAAAYAYEKRRGSPR